MIHPRLRRPHPLIARARRLLCSENILAEGMRRGAGPRDRRGAARRAEDAA